MARDFAGGSATDRVTFPNVSGDVTRSIFVSANADTLDASVNRRLWELEAFGIGSSDLLVWFASEFRFSVGWTGTSGQFNIPVPSAGAYHNVLITYDGSSTANDPLIWVDAAAQTVTRTTAPSGSLIVGTEDLKIGNRSNPSSDRCFDGKVATYGRWDRVLTPAEALVVSITGNPLFVPDGLVFCTFLNGNNSPEIDIAGGLTGTVTGATKASNPAILYPGATKQFYDLHGTPPPPPPASWSVFGDQAFVS